MATDREPVTRSQMSEPPKVPPVAIGLFDEGDYIRHIGDRIASLSPKEAQSLLYHLEQTNVT